MLRIFTALEAFLEVIWLRSIVRVHHLGNLVIAQLLDWLVVVLFVRVINFSFLRGIDEAGGEFRPIDRLLLVFGLRYVHLLILEKHPALFSAEIDSLGPGEAGSVTILLKLAGIVIGCFQDAICRLGVLRRAPSAPCGLDHWLRLGFLFFGVIGRFALFLLAVRLPRLLRLPPLLLAFGGPSIAARDPEFVVGDRIF